ncbi:MAG TPA: bifunctional pyr operon transcriptional regulator/uracil phosphoribosyltransferase PyrR [Polyangiaceae bacterium]|jgi:pyrimidine operon attenuation protein/uracil phosphoribosyltransferase|nr:bifunctional pyr operon transcriptional regulator/uracil phosphoribosyltransferase PyrR [Polyangiaceae bacterium]
MRVLLDAASLKRGLTRVAGQIAERHHGSSGLVLVGIRRGGVPVAERLRACLERIEPGEVPMGTVDITLYRDDAASALPNPRIGASQIPVPLDGRRVLLVDDVVGTGRTVRAALDALLDYGRPRSVELMAVVDRGGRELPIQPDYCIQAVRVEAEERVDVMPEGSDLIAVVSHFGAVAPQPGELSK